MEISLKLEGINELLAKYQTSKVQKAIFTALNRVVRSGKTAASDEIRNNLGFNIMKSDLDRKITIKVEPLRGEIAVAGKPILMSYFKPIDLGTGRRIIKRRGKGAVSFEMKKTRANVMGGVQAEIIKGRKIVLRGGKWKAGPDVAGVFIAKGKGGTPLVFGRLSGSRKLIALKVYSEHNMFKKVLERVADRINEQWTKEWHHQFERLMK